MDDARSGEAEALRHELAKWQERVPKLAGALRERTGEVEALRKELAARAATMDGGSSTSNAGSGIKARDALIEELEAKVKALGGKYQDAEGQLHARDLEITQLRQEAGEWREKWQSLTASLDEQADSAVHKDRELARVQRELDELLTFQETHTGRIKEQDLELTALREQAQSLESRNQNLFETTELANRQIETLGENLEHLRAELKASRRSLAEQEAQAGGSAREIDDLKAQIASRDQDIDFLHKHVEEKQAEIGRLNGKVDALAPLEAAHAAARAEHERLSSLLAERDAQISAQSERLVELEELRQSAAAARARAEKAEGALASSREETAAREATIAARDGELEKQKDEVRHLEECVARAEEATVRFEVERRQLSVQMDELKKRNEHLETQLSERSDLVVGLEQEKSAISSKTSSLEAENKRLSDALEKSQRAAAGNADHIAQVDARLERQKQLMESLEAEFAEVQQVHAEAVKTHQREMSEKVAEVAALSEKVNEDSVSALKQELGELEAQLEEAREAARTTAQSNRTQADEAAEAAREAEVLRAELATLRADEENSRKALHEKIEQLERQLHKQSRAAAEADEALAEARAEIETARHTASRVPDEVSGENAFLQAEVLKLEGMVRERTEQLNKLRWQQDMIEKQGGEDGTSSKMLVVLNQQLQTARDENQRLKQRLREFESRPATPELQREHADDLSSIKGIGPKLVKQLRKLGIVRFDQIATLSGSDLDDRSHPLHSMKGRIMKDNWIDQAARLSGGV